jgi:nucleotide-binding universal stress UspA family protein
MKRILVPTDFSDCANAAAEMALLLAKRSKAEIVFLHLSKDQSDSSQDSDIAYANTEIGQSKIKLDQLVSTAEAKGVKAKAELIEGTGHEHIEDYIKPYRIDWLVMGSHGVTGIREAIIGSKTQHVIRDVSVPTLVVKHKPLKRKPKNIVFASTFQEHITNTLTTVVGFSKLWKANLHLLFINVADHLIEEKAAKSMMTKQVERFSGTKFTQSIIETNDKEFGIAQFAEMIDADMIAVVMESKNILERLLNPSLTEHLINHSPLPVLVIPE